MILAVDAGNTAVTLGYTRARRGAARTLAIFIEHMDYAKSEDFGTDIIIMEEKHRMKRFYGYYNAKDGVSGILEKLSANSFEYKDYGNGHITIK